MFSLAANPSAVTAEKGESFEITATLSDALATWTVGITPTSDNPAIADWKSKTESQRDLVAQAVVKATLGATCLEVGTTRFKLEARGKRTDQETKHVENAFVDVTCVDTSGSGGSGGPGGPDGPGGSGGPGGPGSSGGLARAAGPGGARGGRG
ncbi:MAG TPA: hypothetical protein PKA88_28630, partial [Polyangiaceae bacterium]|nr:hypothetical protein [Polyangiaceae bacterium]